MYPRAGHQHAVRGHGRRSAEGGQRDPARIAGRAARARRRPHHATSSICANGREERIACDGVISTLPLPPLVSMITPALPPQVSEHASKLRYRSLKLIYVALKRPSPHRLPLGLPARRGVPRQPRVRAEERQRRHGAGRSHRACASSCRCWRDEPLWSKSDEEIFELALRDLMKMGYGITPDEVEEYHVTDIPTAYPVYELNFEDHLIPVLEGVHRVPNLLTLGRHGLFLNNSMDDNVLLGMTVGESHRRRRLPERRVAVKDAGVHEPAVPGEMIGRSTSRRPARITRTSGPTDQRSARERAQASRSRYSPSMSETSRSMPYRASTSRRPASPMARRRCGSAIRRLT